MIAYLARRLAWAVVLLFGITLAVFLVVHLSGDPTALYVGPEGTRQDYEMMRAALGFDRPLPEQYGQVLGVPLEREAFGFNPAMKWWGYDPERAKALLKEAGYANGFEMTLHAPNRRYMNDIEVMQAMAAMLGKVGIKANVQVWEQSVYTTKWRKRELLPAYMVAWGGAGVFDGDLLVNSLHSKSALAIHRNETLDKILEEAQGTNDPDKRRALYFRAQEIVFEDAPIIKAYQQAHIFGISNRLDWKPWIDNMLFLYDARLK